MIARRKKRRRAVPGISGEPPKVYVETSVWGMILQNQPRALREPIMAFLRQCAAGTFLPCISAILAEEIAEAPEEARTKMSREIERLAPLVLEKDPASEQLADAYLQAGVSPAKKRQDALHVAVATVAGLRILVSWNHRHLANQRKKDLFNAVNQLAGYEQVLLIHTPLEVMQ